MWLHSTNATQQSYFQLIQMAISPGIAHATTIRPPHFAQPATHFGIAMRTTPSPAATCVWRAYVRGPWRHELPSATLRQAGPLLDGSVLRIRDRSVTSALGQSTRSTAASFSCPCNGHGNLPSSCCLCNAMQLSATAHTGGARTVKKMGHPHVMFAWDK